MRSNKPFTDKAPAGLTIAAIAGLLFLHIPLLIIFIYSFTTDEAAYTFPLPGIVSGIALRSAIGGIGIPFSFWTIVIGHATFCVVVVYNNFPGILPPADLIKILISKD